MDIPRSRAVAEIEILEQTGSTNDDLLARVAADPGLAPYSAVVTTDQTAGRGRLGRTWVAPPGQTLAASTLLRPRLADGTPLPLDSYGWLPLLAGLAMTRAVTAVLPTTSRDTVSLKWPNDVLIAGNKVSGLLAELLPTADGLIVGSGVNLAIPAGELPTATSTSLNLEGAYLEVSYLEGVQSADDALLDAVLAGYLGELQWLVARLETAQGDAVASGLRDAVVERCSSIGARVRVELPGGDTLVGTATGLDETGRLLVQETPDAVVQAVAAGDVTHLRYE